MCTCGEGRAIWFHTTLLSRGLLQHTTRQIWVIWTSESTDTVQYMRVISTLFSIYGYIEQKRFTGLVSMSVKGSLNVSDLQHGQEVESDA